MTGLLERPARTLGSGRRSRPPPGQAPIPPPGEGPGWGHSSSMCRCFFSSSRGPALPRDLPKTTARRHPRDFKGSGPHRPSSPSGAATTGNHALIRPRPVTRLSVSQSLTSSPQGPPPPRVAKGDMYVRRRPFAEPRGGPERPGMAAELAAPLRVPLCPSSPSLRASGYTHRFPRVARDFRCMSPFAAALADSPARNVIPPHPLAFFEPRAHFALELALETPVSRIR